MSRDHSERLLLYATPPHECSYLQGPDAVTVFADPEHPKNGWLHTTLADQGFRRSGRHLYRPQCPSCRACISVRVPVGRFTASRSQRRIWQRNRDLTVSVVEQSFRDEHYALYASYVCRRHPGGGMDAPTAEKYREFLLCDWSDTVMIEFRLDGDLLAVAVCDRLAHGLSAVYTFFDLDHAQRGLGVFAVLWEIHYAREIGLDWLYLGYWIENCRKMRYKGGYLPQERFIDGRWRLHTRDHSD